MTLTRRKSLIMFAALSLLLLASERWIATFVETSRHPDIMAIAITADLVVGVPLLYYLLLARKRFLPLPSIVPVFILTLFAVRFILPPSQQWLLRFSEFLIPAIELSLALFVLFKLRHIIRDVRRARQDSLYFMDALRTGIRKSLRSDLATALLATEVAMFYFVFGGWFTRFSASREDATIYSYYRNSGFTLLFWPIVTLVVVEVGLLHLVVSIWTQAGAWILTSINIYTLLWMVGHFQAARLQPVIVDDNYIYLRTGLIWRSQTPLSKIADIRKPIPVDLKVPGYVNVSLMGEPDLIIVLNETDKLVQRDPEVEAGLCMAKLTGRGTRGLIRKEEGSRDNRYFVGRSLRHFWRMSGTVLSADHRPFGRP